MSTQHPAFHPEHNHLHCITHALEDARNLCKKRNQRFTPIRELVLKTIWQSHKPLGAYELLPALSEAGFNSAPPTVYRALDFLQEQGLVHRIAMLNAYIGCPHPEHKHQSSFLICRVCNNATELESAPIDKQVQEQAKQLGFVPEEHTLEVIGLCPACQKEQQG